MPSLKRLNPRSCGPVLLRLLTASLFNCPPIHSQEPQPIDLVRFTIVNLVVTLQEGLAQNNAYCSQRHMATSCQNCTAAGSACKVVYIFSLTHCLPKYKWKGEEAAPQATPALPVS
jgi:hypothetical protein